VRAHRSQSASKDATLAEAQAHTEASCAVHAAWLRTAPSAWVPSVSRAASTAKDVTASSRAACAQKANIAALRRCSAPAAPAWAAKRRA